MWPLVGEPHDTSALALLRMQGYSRYLSTLGISDAAKKALETIVPQVRSGIESCSDPQTMINANDELIFCR